MTDSVLVGLVLVYTAHSDGWTDCGSLKTDIRHDDDSFLVVYDDGGRTQRAAGSRSIDRCVDQVTASSMLLPLLHASRIIISRRVLIDACRHRQRRAFDLRGAVSADLDSGRPNICSPLQPTIAVIRRGTCMAPFAASLPTDAPATRRGVRRVGDERERLSACTLEVVDKRRCADVFLLSRETIACTWLDVTLDVLFQSNCVLLNARVLHTHTIYTLYTAGRATSP